MPARKTKRGAERTTLRSDYDVIICGASFAGLTIARELTGSGARVLVLDRYEIGERQTSACGIPTVWLEALGLMSSVRQTFDELIVHTPRADLTMKLPWSFSTFDYAELCGLLWAGADSEFETATVEGRADAPALAVNGSPRPIAVATDRGTIEAPLVVDALGWRRVLGEGHQPPGAPLSRGLEVHPEATGDRFEIWIERDVVPAGYGWSFPATDELRVGVGSFDPNHHVKEPTVDLAARLGLPPDGYQGNWIPHRLRDAVERDAFFCGDSAGHCLPLTAEGIRPAFYFGIACARELRSVIEGRSSRDAALTRYGAFNDAHRWKYESMLRVQRAVPRIPPSLLAPTLKALGLDRSVRWSFDHYLNICSPSIAETAYDGRGEPAIA